jgi:hypothetical protein
MIVNAIALALYASSALGKMKIDCRLPKLIKYTTVHSYFFCPIINARLFARCCQL